MVIDFHVHIGLKEHWHAWVQDYQKATGSEYYERYEELTDPDRFALYLPVTTSIVISIILSLIFYIFTRR